MKSKDTKKAIAISLSTIMLLNAAPVFALQSTATSDVQGAALSAQPESTVKAETPTAGSKRSSKQAELQAVAAAAGEDLYLELGKIMTTFEAQKKSLEGEKDPFLRGLKAVSYTAEALQYLLAADVRAHGKGSKATAYASAMADITKALTSGWINIVKNPNQPMAALLETQVEAIRKQIEADVIADEDVKELLLDLNKISIEIKTLETKLADNQGDNYKKLATATLSIGMMFLMRKAPSLEQLADSTQKIGAVTKHSVRGTRYSGITADLVMEKYLSVLGVSSAEVQTLIKSIADKIELMAKKYKASVELRLRAIEKAAGK